MSALVLIAVLLLAYSNGANDNFKGVATLFGSGTTHYRKALAWATVTTLIGSSLALVLAQGLVASFRGRGLVPDHVTAEPAFMLAVSLGAGLTVLLAALGGLPISTTHALIGGRRWHDRRFQFLSRDRTPKWSTRRTIDGSDFSFASPSGEW